MIGITDSLDGGWLTRWRLFHRLHPYRREEWRLPLKGKRRSRWLDFKGPKRLPQLPKVHGRSAMEAIKTWSTNPAILFGLADKQGTIEVGKAADYLLLNEKDELVSTVIGGQEVYHQ
jgi:cytosine/adenosine deaminase-related metal-dependent hydrolase